jgi:NAD dependent epimerase/dehydratase family enzyme
MSGAINAVAPEPCTNREYTKTLGALLSRPTIVPLPALVARAAFGEMADALLLSSTRVEAGKLKAAGFSYRTPTLGQVLARTLGRA